MVDSANRTRPEVLLRGYERMMTMTDAASVKIAHVAALHGSSDAVSAFLKHAPQALALTFNKHPRMRVKQVRGEFAMAEVYPAITTATVLADKLFEAREVTSDPTEKWESYVERESNIPIDRYASFPFYLRAWHYPNENNLLRLMLFSDHYMSDGISGLTVLNDVLEFASKMSREDRVLAPTLPLPPSLYDLWLKPKPWWSRFLSEGLVGLFGKSALKREVASFKPVFPVRSDQVDFQIPVKVNSSSLLFGHGTRANMQAALRRCKEEGVTFFGALAAAITVAFYLAKRGDKDKEPSMSHEEPLFKPVASLAYNMRSRVQHPISEDQVGCYMSVNGIETLSKAGVDMATDRFWDFARQVKHDVDAQLESFRMPFQLLLLDGQVNSKTQPKFFQDVPIPRSITSDLSISSVGKYPHKSVHSMKTPGGQFAELSITSIHFSSSLPHLGRAAGLYVSSVDQLCYSMMHKYEGQVADRLFAAFTTAVEQIGQVAAGETMIEVVNRVRKQLLQH